MPRCLNAADTLLSTPFNPAAHECRFDKVTLMLTTKTEHRLSAEEAIQIKQTLVQLAHVLDNPEATALNLISAFRVVDEATEASEPKS